MEILRATTYSFLATKISQPMILIYLEVVSFIGSIIFIKLVSLIPKAKKYVYDKIKKHGAMQMQQLRVWLYV